MTERATWLQSATEELGTIAGLARGLRTWRDGLTYLAAYIDAVAGILDQLQEIQLEPAELHDLHRAFVFPLNELTTFVNEANARVGTPRGDTFEHLSRDRLVWTVPASLSSALDKLDAEAHRQMLRELIALTSFFAGLQLALFTTDKDTHGSILQVCIGAAVGAHASLLSMIPDELLLGLDRRVNALPTLYSRMTDVKQLSRGRLPVIIDIARAWDRAEALVVVSMIRGVKTGDRTQVDVALAAQESIIQFFYGADRRSLPERDVLEFDGMFNYASLLRGLQAWNARVIRDDHYLAIVDLSDDPYDRRLFVVYPDHSYAFSDVITFEREEEYVAMPLRYTFEHAGELFTSVGKHVAEQTYAEILAARENYTDAAWLAAIARAAKAANEYAHLTPRHLSKAAAISVTTVALHQVFHASPVQTIAVDIAIHLIVDRLFERREGRSR